MEEKDPEFKRTENKADIIKIINQRLLSKPLTVQLPSLEDKYGHIVKATEQGVVVHFKNFIPPDQAITLSGFIENYYSEIELTIDKTIHESVFLCRTNYLRISSQRRSEPRFPVNDPGQIFLKRIKISKNDLNITPETLPKDYVSLLAKFEEDYSHLADTVKISPFSTGSKIHQEVYKTGKTFFIPNLLYDRSFIWDENKNEDLINLSELFGDSLESEKTNMLRRKIMGRIVLPIVGPKGENMWSTIGHIDIISKKPIDFDLLRKVKSLSLEIVEKFQELNVTVFDEKFNLLDISKNGMCFLVNNDDLKKIMMRSSQFGVYIMINGQAPITVNCWIRMKKLLEDGMLKVGVKIQGETTRQDQIIRYWKYIESLQEK